MSQEVLVDDKENTSAVTCIDTFDISDDGKEELLIGRRDGVVQVFTMNLPTVPSVEDAVTFAPNADTIELESQEIFKENFSENISCIQGGCVGQNGYNEILICTYSGRIFGLTTQCISRSLTDNKLQQTNDASNRMAKLKLEIAELEAKVLKEREKYQMSTQALSSGLSAIPMLAINDSVCYMIEKSWNLMIVNIHHLFFIDDPVQGGRFIHPFN